MDQLFPTIIGSIIFFGSSSGNLAWSREIVEGINGLETLRSHWSKPIHSELSPISTLLNRHGCWDRSKAAAAVHFYVSFNWQSDPMQPSGLLFGFWNRKTLFWVQSLHQSNTSNLHFLERHVCWREKIPISASSGVRTILKTIPVLIIYRF